MIGLGLVISIIVMLILVYLNDEKNINLFSVISFLLCLVIALGIIAIVLVHEIVEKSNINEQINLYQEENKKINESVKMAVEFYIKSENENLTPMLADTNYDSYIAMVYSLPDSDFKELRESELLKLYYDNAEKIKELGEEKADVSNLKWLLYFGN